MSTEYGVVFIQDYLSYVVNDIFSMTVLLFIYDIKIISSFKYDYSASLTLMSLDNSLSSVEGLKP